MVNDLITEIYKKMDDIENQLKALDVKKADLEHTYRVYVDLLKTTNTEALRGNLVTDDGIVEELPIKEITDGVN